MGFEEQGPGHDASAGRAGRTAAAACRRGPPVVKRLRQAGRRGGGRGQARRVGMVRRLLQRLDQVVSVLRVYGPEGAFAYALKETEEGTKTSVSGDASGSVQALRKRGAQTPKHRAERRYGRAPGPLAENAGLDRGHRASAAS